MLSVNDVLINFIIVLILFVSMFIVSLIAIKGNKEDTEYTKNVKLNKKRKIILGFLFYKGDKIEMEAVINQILNYILTMGFVIASFYIDLQPKMLGICYGIAGFSVFIGCLIYRFKTDDFKDSKDHYE